MDIAQLGRISSVLFTGDGQSITYPLKVLPLVNNFRRMEMPVPFENRRHDNFYLVRQYYCLDCIALSIDKERTVEEFMLKLVKKAFPNVQVEGMVALEPEDPSECFEISVRVRNIHEIVKYSVYRPS